MLTSFTSLCRAQITIYYRETRDNFIRDAGVEKSFQVNNRAFDSFRGLKLFFSAAKSSNFKFFYLVQT